MIGLVLGIWKPPTKMGEVRCGDGVPFRGGRWHHMLPQWMNRRGAFHHATELACRYCEKGDSSYVVWNKQDVMDSTS